LANVLDASEREAQDGLASGGNILSSIQDA
jgi:hypothetical protein